MNLKYTGILFAAALGLWTQVRAEEVVLSNAFSVARGWMAQRSAHFEVDAARTRHYYVTANSNVSFYAVKMRDGGTVFLSGNTEDAPVLAFTSSTNDLSNLDEKSPLWSILKRNLEQTQQARVEVLKKSKYNTVRQRVEALWTANQARWKNLRVQGGLAYAITPGTSPAQTSVSDLRVAPLVKTQWAQENVGAAGHEWACYNYLTPDGPDFSAKVAGNKNNADCGCVATAMAQVLKYFEYPNEHLMTAAICQPERQMNGGMKRDCYWANDDGTIVTNKDVEIIDKPYDWANMTLTPGVNDNVPPMGDRAKEIGFAIGQLTFNCGVAVGMQYSANGSGAYSYDVPNALRKTFLVRTAVHFVDSYDLTGGKYYTAKATIGTRTNALQRVMFSNFDAGLPVIVGLDGHAVVADGYGYEEGEPFVHFNMGWAGQGDLWYNVPNLLESGYFGVEDVTYNIFTNKWSAYPKEPRIAVLSGRCLDADGNPLKNAKVRIFESDTGTEIAGPGPTSEYGVWGVAPIYAGKYDIYGESEDGELAACLLGVEVEGPVTQEDVVDSRGDKFDCVIPKTPEEIGNSWGNDLKLVLPNYEVDGKTFQRLEDALAKVQESQTIYVLRDAPFEHSFTARVSCAIQVKDGVDATNAVVSVSKGVRLYVADGARLSVKGVLFECADAALVEVQKGGTLALAGEVALPTVRTSDATGFELAGAIRPVGGVVCIDCPVAQFRDQLFGTFSCDYPTAIACKTNIVNKYDLELGGVAQNMTGELVWDRVADPATAIACYDEPYVGGRPGTSYYNSLTTLFKDCTNGSVITVLRNCGKLGFQSPYGSAIRIAKSIKFTANPGVVIEPASSVCLEIVAGGRLTLENITFSNYLGNTPGACLFKVAGGELVLGEGASLQNFAMSQYCHDNVNGKVYGATALLNGKLTMLPGSEIIGCQARHSQGRGGAICALNGVLDLQGGTIENCSALNAGGGVYALNAVGTAYNAQVYVSGDVVIRNNTSGDGQVDNLCLEYGQDLGTGAWTPFVVTGAVTSAAKAIGVRYLTDAGNGRSNVFAKVEADLSADELKALCQAFAHDVTSEQSYSAVASEDEQSLFWEVVPETGHTCSPDIARFVVVYDDKPDTPYFYSSIANVFEDLSGDATVSVTNWTDTADVGFHYYSGLEINHRVVFVGQTDASSCGIRRHNKNCPIRIAATGELILTNIVISGANSGGGAYPLILVEGGKLELQSGASVRSASSNGSRACGGVVVWKGGTFTMRKGSEIRDCGNQYTTTSPANCGVGGGLLVENATAYLLGGKINGCYTAIQENGGGVCLANKAVAYISGEMYIWGNGSPLYNNIVVEDFSRLNLDGAIGSSMYIGVDPGVQTDTNLVAHVSWADATTNELTASAKRFRQSNNMDVYAVPVTNDVETILVWSTAVAADGTYIDRDGNAYAAFAATPEPPPEPEPEYAEPKPIAFKAISRDATTVALVVTDAVQWCWYSFFATNTLDGGFVLTNAAGDYIVKPVTNFQWQFTTPNIELTLPVDGDQRFWKAEAARGEIPTK